MCHPDFSRHEVQLGGLDSTCYDITQFSPACNPCAEDKLNSRLPMGNLITTAPANCLKLRAINGVGISGNGIYGAKSCAKTVWASPYSKRVLCTVMNNRIISKLIMVHTIIFRPSTNYKQVRAHNKKLRNQVHNTKSCSFVLIPLYFFKTVKFWSPNDN